MSLKVAMKRVQTVTGGIHVHGPASCVLRREQISESFRMRGPDSRFGTGIGKPLQSLVPIAPNHAYSV